MFDVIWTDHNRELVGERRARKELDSKPKKKDDAPSNRSSMSTASSSSSRHDKPSGFLGAISRIKTAQSSKSRSLTTAHSQESTGTSLKDAHSLSLTPASTWPDDRLSINDMVERRGNADAARDSYENTPDRSSRGESIFSKWTDQTSATPASPFGGSFYEGGSKSQFIQSLGPSSYVRKTTEVVVEPRTPTDQAEQLFSGVTITSGGPLDRPPTPVSPKELLVTPIQDTAGVRFNQGDRSASPPRSGQGAHPNWTANSETSSSVMSTGTFGRRTDLVLSMPKLRFTNGNADAWRPPDAWDCPPQESKFPAIEDTISYSPNDDSTSMALDLAGMQREVKRMAAAGPRIVLLRLREEWGSSTDAALYKELEMEKKRWMLSALHNMDPPPNTGVKTEPKNQKILAFFETQATASYLAAVHAGSPIYHMSPAPLSHKLFPSIHPMLFPTVPSASFPVAPQFFSDVHSLSLPALVPSTEIPALLRNIHRVLAPRGTLHLTVIDPAPVRTTVGPRMQAWLDERLLLNLQRHFRCMSPSQLLPSWLADAQLRGEGSMITKLKFPAVTSWPSGAAPDNAEAEIAVELRSEVARMLWNEVWGQYVTADKWWWEDSDIIDECRRLDTYWEVRMIEAVKQPS